MMGFGPYGGNAHGSGGSSNLSALAPPFTVDRSIIKPMVTPLVDVAEPLNWLDSNPFSFNSPQPGQLPMLDLEPIPTPSYNKNSDLFEPKTYYSPYVSQTLHPPTFNEHNLSGLELTAQWGGGWWDWEKRNPAQLGGSFYPKEASVAPPTIYTDHISLGPHPSSSLKTCEVTTHNNYSLVRESKVGPPDIETLDYSPVLGQNFSYMPVDYLKTSVIGPSSAPPESNLQVPPLNPVNVKNNQVPLSTSYEKPVRQLSNAPSDIPVLKSSPGVVIRPAAADACPLVSHAVPFKNFDSGINRNDTILTGNNLSSVNEYHYLLNFGSKNDSDPSQPSSHLDGNSYLSGESSASRSEKLSTSNMASKDASDLLFREKSGDASSRVTPNNFSLALNDTEPVTAMENSLESSDHFNPHVDSPCWKGAPYSHISPFESSEPVSVQPVNKLDLWDGSTGQALNFIPTNAANTVKLPSGKQNKIATTVEHGNMEHDLVSSLTFPSFSIPLFKEHSDDVGKTGSNQKKTGSACGIKFSQDAREQKKDFVLFNKPVDMIERASCNIQQSLAEGRLASKNVPTSETGVAYHERTSDVSGCGSSHMSCHAVKDLSCFPSSVEDISTKHSKCLGQEPVSNSSISVLLSTMQNLSELLLYQYLNETCELQDKDIKSLEKIIKNLDTCMPKNTEKKSFFSDLDEGTSKGRPQMAAIDVLSQHVQEKEKLSGNGDVKFPEFVSVETGAHGKAKNDKMAQAIKKILIDNFHEKEEANPQVNLYKNLWLEAEAALCSVNYMARFYNMKVELGKCKLDSGEDVSKESPDDDKISGSKVPVDINTNKLTAVAESGSISAVSSNQDSPIRNSSYHADAVTAKFSVEVNADAKLTAVAESGPILATSNQNSHIRNSSNGNSVDDLAARFQVLRQRLNNSNSVHTRDVDELTSSKLSLDLDKVDELAPEVKYSLTSGMQSPDSLVPVTACHTNDVEASVMARFHILKSSDIDDLDSNEMKRKLLPKVVDLGFAGKRRQISIDEDTAVDGVSGVNPKPVSQNQGANHDAEQVVTKDFHPCVQYDCSVQSPGSTRLGAQVSDNCSSDWEHVLKEELSGQNN